MPLGQGSRFDLRKYHSFLHGRILGRELIQEEVYYLISKTYTSIWTRNNWTFFRINEALLLIETGCWRSKIFEESIWRAIYSDWTVFLYMIIWWANVLFLMIVTFSGVRDFGRLRMLYAALFSVTIRGLYAPGPGINFLFYLDLS